MSVWKWDKIFFRRKKVHSEGEECTESKRLEDFERQIGLLLHSDRFIARSDYRPIHERYAELMSVFLIWKRWGCWTCIAKRTV